VSLDVAQLRCFVAVADELNFTRAAGRLGVPQSAVSVQIRTLERRLGTPLFVRTTRSVRLTPDGEHLLGRARDALAAVDDVGAVAALRRARPLGRLTLALETMHPSLEALLAATLPGTPTTIRIVDPVDHLEPLARGDIDACVGWDTGSAPLPLPRGVGRRRLFHEPLFLAVGSGHRLAGAAVIPVSELSDEVWVARPAGTRQRLLVERLCVAAGFLPHIGYETEDGQSVAALLAAGRAVALTSPLARATPDLVGVALDGVGTREVFAAWPEKSTPDPVARSLIGAFRSSFRRVAAERAAESALPETIRAAAAAVMAQLDDAD
jgi:LysR family transcriptional regulator, benzoate and cis,cis-muconate-responsive activator of ben and cat genes